MPSEATLAWALVDVVSICFTADDRLGIYTALGAGETYSAIQRMLVIAVRRRYRLPATLIAALTGWLDCYIGNEHEPMTRGLLNRVEPQALGHDGATPRATSDGQVVESAHLDRRARKSTMTNPSAITKRHR